MVFIILKSSSPLGEDSDEAKGRKAARNSLTEILELKGASEGERRGRVQPSSRWWFCRETAPYPGAGHLGSNLSCAWTETGPELVT